MAFPDFKWNGYKTKLEGRFPLSKWLRDNLPKFLLPDGETEIPVGPDPRRMQGGSTFPRMNEKEFKAFLEYGGEWCLF